MLQGSTVMKSFVFHLFLETCLDHIDFMGSLLDIDLMLDRKGYEDRRNSRMSTDALSIKSEDWLPKMIAGWRVNFLHPFIP